MRADLEDAENLVIGGAVLCSTASGKKYAGVIDNSSDLESDSLNIRMTGVIGFFGAPKVWTWKKEQVITRRASQ